MLNNDNLPYSVEVRTFIVLKWIVPHLTWSLCLIGFTVRDCLFHTTLRLYFNNDVSQTRISKQYSFTSVTRTLLSRISVNLDHDREKNGKNITGLFARLG